jgi:hypothetical protein
MCEGWYFDVLPFMCESWYFTYMRKALYEEGRLGPIKLVLPHHFLLKDLCQAKKVSCHVFVC